MHSGSRSEDRDRVSCAVAAEGASSDRGRGDACAVVGEGEGALLAPGMAGGRRMYFFVFVVVVMTMVVLALCYATVMDIRKNAARLWLVIELGRVTDAQCDRQVPSNAAGAESAHGRDRGAGAPPGRRLDLRGSPSTPACRRPGASVRACACLCS